jgi:hypothetical protein
MIVEETQNELALVRMRHIKTQKYKNMEGTVRKARIFALLERSILFNWVRKQTMILAKRHARGSLWNLLAILTEFLSELRRGSFTDKFDWSTPGF